MKLILGPKFLRLFCRPVFYASFTFLLLNIVKIKIADGQLLGLPIIPAKLDLGPLFSIQLSPDQLSINSTKCLGPLGCFSNGPPFQHPIKRPISLLPYDRVSLDVRFQLFTRKNPNEAEELFAENRHVLKDSSFDPSEDTKIVIHGLMDAIVTGKWLLHITKEFLLKDNYNVIVVDWARANRLPYEQAVANARAVGAEVALLIRALIKHVEADPKKFHLIGHSLGAHVSGYAGERIKGLRRITGLDPAGPYFTGTDREVRLDSTDASFVDVIHSDSSTSILSGLGIIEPIGDVDFYPNNANRQPGCQKMPGVFSFLTQGLAEGLRRAATCDHQRAIDFFIASINNKDCEMVGIDCPDWEYFVKGRCGDCERDGSRCALMGAESENYSKTSYKKRRYFLRTSGETPYCLHQYQVTLTLEDDPDANIVSGDAFVTIEGSRVRLRARLNEKLETFRPGSYYTYLIASRRAVGTFNSATFHWSKDPMENYESRSRKPREPQIFVKQLRISPLEIGHRSGRSMVGSRALCPDKKEPIHPNQPVLLTTNGNC